MLGYLIVTDQIPEETMMIFGGITFVIVILGVFVWLIDTFTDWFKE